MSAKSGSLSIACIQLGLRKLPVVRSSRVSTILGSLKYWSEWKDSRNFQNCPLYHGCPLFRGVRGSTVSVKERVWRLHACRTAVSAWVGFTSTPVADQQTGILLVPHVSSWDKLWDLTKNWWAAYSIVIYFFFPAGSSCFFSFPSQIIPPSSWVCPSLPGLPLWQGCHTHCHTPLPPHYWEPHQLSHCGGGEEGDSSTPLPTPERPKDHWAGGSWVSLILGLSTPCKSL